MDDTKSMMVGLEPQTMNTEKTSIENESQPDCLCAVIGRASHKIKIE
jgi:hypothetical protein